MQILQILYDGIGKDAFLIAVSRKFSFKLKINVSQEENSSLHKLWGNGTDIRTSVLFSIT